MKTGLLGPNRVFIWEKHMKFQVLTGTNLSYKNDPSKHFIPRQPRTKYVWYLDPKYNNHKVNDLIWVICCRPEDNHYDQVIDMGLLEPDLIVEQNPEAPNIELDLEHFMPPHWDCEYECAYFLPEEMTGDRRIWIKKTSPTWCQPSGWKEFEAVPKWQFKMNPKLPNIEYDIDYIVPYYDLEYEHVWNLKRDYLPEGSPDIWAVKINCTFKPKGVKYIGEVEPDCKIEINPVLGPIRFDINYQPMVHDLAYEHVWMLDERHIPTGDYDIWAVKAKFVKNPIGTKIIGSVSPECQIEYNPEVIDKISLNEELYAAYHDFEYTQVWYLKNSKIWVFKINHVDSPIGYKEMGEVTPDFADRLDVIFISYHEPNAEENWQRVLTKAPWARRVDGIEGIFNAHKAAAKLASSDMFYVVDGDAWLADDFNFDFQPNLFDRDCAYVWQAVNPINGLTYENGGVKLFNKRILNNTKKWTTLDMFTGIMPKTKSMPEISCETRFNVDAFNTWRSAFRECVKLFISNQFVKLDTWQTKGKNKQFGKYAISGAKSAVKFVEQFPEDLLKINNNQWLRDKFSKENLC